MLNITIDNMIRIRAAEINHYPELKAKIQNDLTLDNPAYISALKRGVRPWRIPRHIKLWRYKDGFVGLPRGYLDTLLEGIGTQSVLPIKLNFETVTLLKVVFNSTIELRPYQDAVISSIVTNQGVICGPCGCGKTQIGLEIIARKQQPALWICHTKELLEQTVSRAAECLVLDRKEIGVIGDGTSRMGDRLTVGLVQSLVKMELPVEKFGLIMVDEIHHAPSYTFDKVIQQFPAAYRYGLTATPERADGMTKAMFAVMGPLLCEITRDAVPTVTPRIEIVYTGCKAAGGTYTEILDYLVKNTYRNELITDVIAQNAANNFCLVLSERIEHLLAIEEILNTRLPHARKAVITGQMGKRKRQEIMEAALQGKIDILLATQLAREGLDIPHLNRLFLVTPKRARGAVQQEIGRIMRPCDGKVDAVVFDFVDDCKMLLSQFRERKKVYKELGMVG